jgi:hypothetical protein
MRRRPCIYVLAGPNGGGRSSKVVATCDFRRAPQWAKPILAAAMR